MSFGERLKELREEKRMTQKDIGDLLGVSGRQVGNYEANKQIFRDEQSFLKIFKFFSVSADYLFGLSKERNYSEMFHALEMYKTLSKQSKAKLIDYINYLVLCDKEKKQ